MADIASTITLFRWLQVQAEPYMDLSNDFLYSIMLHRGVTDDETYLSDTTEKQRDLCRADIYWAAATSSLLMS